MAAGKVAEAAEVAGWSTYKQFLIPGRQLEFGRRRCLMRYILRNSIRLLNLVRKLFQIGIHPGLQFHSWSWIGQCQ